MSQPRKSFSRLFVLMSVTTYCSNMGFVCHDRSTSLVTPVAIFKSLVVGNHNRYEYGRCGSLRVSTISLNLGRWARCHFNVATRFTAYCYWVLLIGIVWAQWLARCLVSKVGY